MKKYYTEKQQEMVDALGQVIWAAIDICWMSKHSTVCYILLFPLVIAALSLVVRVQENKLKLYNCIWLSWYMMNIFWMSSELLEMPKLFPFAEAFGILGFVFLALSLSTKVKREVVIHHMISTRRTIKNLIS